jgi:sulfonate transport system substrate-binding protein
MTIPDGLSALVTGGVDAAVVSGGQEDALVQEGQATILHIGFEADKDTYYEPMVLIGRTKIIDENPDVAVALTKALLKAKDKIAEDTDAYYQLSAEKSGNPLTVILATAEENLDIAFPLNLDQTYIDSLKQIQEFLISNGLTTNEIDIEEWLNASVVQQAIEEYNSEK